MQWSGKEFTPLLGELDIVRWSQDVCQGVLGLHSIGVVHRDIKPQNILVKGGHALLADFGVSYRCQSGHERLTQTEGTIHFLAPEVCDPDVESYEGKPVDVWALGVTLFCMVFKHLPWSGQTEYFVMENIRNQPLKIPETSIKINPELLDLIIAILGKKDPL